MQTRNFCVPELLCVAIAVIVFTTGGDQTHLTLICAGPKSSEVIEIV